MISIKFYYNVLLRKCIYTEIYFIIKVIIWEITFYTSLIFNISYILTSSTQYIKKKKLYIYIYIKNTMQRKNNIIFLELFYYKKIKKY